MSEALCECVFDCPPPPASRTAGLIAEETAALTETGEGAGEEVDIKETEEEAEEEVEEEEGTLVVEEEEEEGRTGQAGTR